MRNNSKNADLKETSRKPISLKVFQSFLELIRIFDSSMPDLNEIRYALKELSENGGVNKKLMVRKRSEH